MIEVTVNGAVRELPEGTTVASLVERLELQPRYVAVEVNLQLVPRARHTVLALSAGDRVEVVTLVGGG